MASIKYGNIIYEKNPPVAYVTLNRPEKLNSLSMDLQLEVRDALEDAGWKDDEIRVIVLKGDGRGFSAGFDISGESGGIWCNGSPVIAGATKHSAHQHGGMFSGIIPNR